jgi:hypothetical protein
MRTILAIGIGDAYYIDRKELIGKKCKFEGNHKSGGFYSGQATFKSCPIKRHQSYGRMFCFYRVKLSKEKK